MKTIDLGNRLDESSVSTSKDKHPKYYPHIDFSDKGVGGVSSFDDKDIGKIISVKAEIKLVGISSNSDAQSKGKRFNYSFEVRRIHMADDLSQQEDYVKTMNKDRPGK